MNSSWMEVERPTATHFFKSIPRAFSGLLNKEKSKEAIIMSRKGSWHVGIGVCDEGNIYFEEGWSEFVQHHDLNIADFLVFQHKGLMHFEVLIFGPSACEKEFPNGLDEDEKIAPVRVNIQKHTKQDNRVNPLEKAASDSQRNPYFETTIHSSGIRGNLTVPADFVRSNDLVQRNSLTLRDPSGKSWPVKLNHRHVYARNSRRLTMGRGWSSFYASNKLKKGDVCIFELIDTTRKFGTVLMDVQIFRAPI
ncbi:unnamed protein product [Ilex paraguariensis]|uniref:TF-B3 domain-containing protein n=1 Tax=Ilex paraguariensis TaxID=185542 RepID=A0ABC8UE21_9AQUA